MFFQLEDVLDINFERILELNDNVSNGNSISSNNTNNNEKTNDIVGVTFEDWSTRLNEKYQNLHDVVERNLPNLWHYLEFELSIQKILNIQDCTLPFAQNSLRSTKFTKNCGN